MKKGIIGFILGALIFGSIGVYATAKYVSKDISYTKQDGTVTNVENALNDLYNESNNLFSRIDGAHQNSYYSGDRIKNQTTNLELTKGNYYVFLYYSQSWRNSIVSNIDKKYENLDFKRLNISNMTCELVDANYHERTASSLIPSTNLYIKNYFTEIIIKCSVEEKGNISVIQTEDTENSTLWNVSINSIKID